MISQIFSKQAMDWMRRCDGWFKWYCTASLLETEKRETERERYIHTFK